MSLSYLLKYRSNSSWDGKMPMSFRPIISSDLDNHPFEFRSKILKASNILKSDFYMS
jgi:hypothetical protein